MAMPDICTDLAKLLSTVKRPGDFFASGRLELPAPRLKVDGVGQIALPLLPVQAEQLIAVAERAPYGRGADTIVDTNVRRTWQIGPDRVHIDGKHWQETLDRAVAMAAAGLGVDEPVSAEFYKLLVYDKGSFFVSHRDTEKEAGMFATLVLALPSLSSGGELVVRHKEREAKLDLANDEPSEMTFAAFYADCVHEVLPITAGCRATLIYNLVRGGKGKGALRPPEYEAETARAAALLREWGQQSRTQTAADAGIPEEDDESEHGGVPEKVIYPLAHAYSPAELDFAKLKGADAAVAALLTSAAPQAECDLHLALISIEETGSAEYDGSYRGHRRYHDDEDDDDEGFEAGEIFERDECLTEWRRADGAPADLGTLPIEDGEVSPPDALEDLKPDEVHFHEATGNEGASFERTYRHAALVLWPRQRRLAVLNQAGTEATLPYIESLAAKWTSTGARQDKALWTEAHELSGHMLDTWAEGEGYYSDDDGEDVKTGTGAADDKRSSLASLLTALTALEDTVRIEAALTRMASQRGHRRHDNTAILGAVALFPPERAAGMIEAIVAGHATETPGACCTLLGGAAAGPFATGPKRLAAATKSLIASLAGDPARVPPPAHPWQRPHHRAPRPGAVAALVTVAEAVDTGMSRDLAAYLLAWPKTYGLDDVLIPAVKRLLKSGTPRSGTATVELLTACLAHLETRTAEPLEAPKNWKRASSIGCKCEHCTALSCFLADPATETWTLKAREEIRSHVEGIIRTAQADVDVTTERKGSPHRLVCRKNSASYERRVAQRRKDVADIAVLKGADAAGPAN
jgi:predicted 2-oxoglutarate/Fe(II)-dependent dioxygenase YbiX